MMIVKLLHELNESFMKKLFLLFLPGLLGLAGGAAQAQFLKGTGHFGVTVSAEGSVMDMENTTNIDTESSTHAISPSIQFGKFIKDNTMFGLGLTTHLNFTKTSLRGQDISYDSKYNYQTFVLSPFIRRYKFLGEKFGIFIQPGLNLSYIHGKGSGEDPSADNGFGVGAYITPGIVYRISPRFALETDVNVLSLNLGYTKMDDWHNVYFAAGITSNIQSYFGLRAAWYFTKAN